MAKKRRKTNRPRSTQNRAASKSPANTTDVLEGPGFRMERHGRAIHVETNRTPEEQAALIERMAASAGPMRSGLAEKAEAIRTCLAEFDTFTILGVLGLMNHLLDPETYEEHSHEGKSTVAEYAALLMLKGPYSRGSRLFPDSATLHKIQMDIDSALAETMLLHMAEDARRSVAVGQASEEPSEADELRFMMRAHEFGVRNPAYEHHHHEVLHGLFQPFDTVLTDSLGFTVDEAVRLAGAIPRLMGDRFAERLNLALEQARSLEDEVRKARGRGGQSPKRNQSTRNTGGEMDAHTSFIADLTGLPRKEMKRFIRSTSISWVLLAADEICSCTPQEVAASAGTGIRQAAAFLGAFAMEFGDMPPDFYEFSPTHPLRRRPLIHHAGRYLCPAPMLLDWAIQPALEAALKALGGRTWQRYEKHRHDWLLGTTVRLLNKMMPSTEFATNLFYDQQGDRSKEAELDALGCYDGVVFLIEAKGADVTEPARRGAPKRLQRDLARVISESHRQAVRAKEHLGAASDTRFRRSNGGADVVVHTRDVRDIMLISVSLAPLGHLTALLHADSQLGFFHEGEYSWVVSIYDLMVIADIVDLPPVFPHYVKRRVHTGHLGFLAAHDELDIFAYYLFEGLYLDEVAARVRAEKGPNARFQLLSFTGPLDAYYFHITGARKKAAPKPTQRMDPSFRALIERLESSAISGRVDTALMLLDLNEASRKGWLQAVQKARKISRREHRVSNASVTGHHDDGWGLTYMCGDAETKPGERLAAYCDRKRREMGARTWIGFAEELGRSPRVVKIVLSRPGPQHQR
jgi:hypothetical protein